MDPLDLSREMDKVVDALTRAADHFAKKAESNAALHLADRVLYPPLATTIINAQISAAKVRDALIGEAGV